MPDWKAIREASKRLGGDEPEDWGWLLWLDARMASETRADGGSGEPPTTPWWRTCLQGFWRSGSPFFAGAVGIRGTKSTTIVKASVMAALMRERTSVLDQVAVWGVMSANTAEANQRCDTIAKLLRGVGLSECAKLDDVTPERFAASISVTTGRSHFTAIDASGNRIRWAISPPTKSAASGWTGAGFFADELDLWQDGEGQNPAADVLTLAHGRLHGQRGAHGYHVSAPMGRGAPLSLMIDEAEKSGTDGLYVARLGELGARRDHEARAALRAHFQRRALEAETAAHRATASRYADDPRLSADADPRATRIPTWAARAGDPAAEILECWRLSSLRLKSAEDGGDPLDVLMARYGAQTGDDGGRRLFSAGVLAEARARAPMW